MEYKTWQDSKWCFLNGADERFTGMCASCWKFKLPDETNAEFALANKDTGVPSRWTYLDVWPARKMWH